MTDTELKVHRLNKIANFFILSEDEELTLIDTGSPNSIRNIRAKFARKGCELSRLKRIVITHSHFDHAGNLAALKNAVNAVVMAHEAEAPYVAHQKRIPTPKGALGFLFYLGEPFSRPRRVDVDVLLKDGDVIEGAGIRVIHAPGHTPGSICLYHEGAKALFTGDTLLNNFNRLTGASSFFSSDIDKARNSVKKLLNLDVDTIYFSHGPTMRDVPGDAIQSVMASFK